LDAANLNIVGAPPKKQYRKQVDKKGGRPVTSVGRETFRDKKQQRIQVWVDTIKERERKLSQ
jgi:hypothetical protein